MPLQATSGAASYDAFGGGVAAVPNYIEDVFSTWLYTGNGSTQTITNGIDLAGKGGMVWAKSRQSINGYIMYDTARGPYPTAGYLGSSDADFPSVSNAEAYGNIPTFNSNGYVIGSTSSVNVVNVSGQNNVSWTFRKQAKFFDIVTWTGTGVDGQVIPHSLGVKPSVIIVKRTDTTSNWQYNDANDNYLILNSTAASAGSNRNGGWIPQYNTTATTLTTQNYSGNSNVNASGGTYVAYLFASNAGGFGLTGTDNVISCGSYTGDGSNGQSVTLGYEPQWLLIKRTDTANSWFLQDNMRPFSVTATEWLQPNTSNAESTGGVAYVSPTATGFTFTSGGAAAYNASGGTYIYIAIRRGPMKVPTSGTSVFKPFTRAGNDTQTDVTGVGFTPDLWMVKDRTQVADFPFFDRLRGVTKRVVSNSTNAEETFSGSNGLVSLNMDGITIGAGALDGGICNDTGSNYGNWLLKRAPSFFDEVCYTGNGTAARNITHNLTVAPEMIIVKGRTNTEQWPVWATSIAYGSNNYLSLASAVASGNTDVLNYNETTNTAVPPTSTTFTVGTHPRVNSSGVTYVAYLFATCAGVSKVFNYTGNGSSQTINCGFTAGARWILIKRTDSTGDWYVWDSARGIVSGNDPHLSLNTTDAEVTSDDTIDTDSTGFVVNQVSATNVNVSSATYIGLAIA